MNVFVSIAKSIQFKLAYYFSHSYSLLVHFSHVFCFLSLLFSRLPERLLFSHDFPLFLFARVLCTFRANQWHFASYLITLPLKHGECLGHFSCETRMAYILNACSLVLGQKVRLIVSISERDALHSFSHTLILIDWYLKKNVAALGKHFQLISILFRVCHWFLKNYENEDGLWKRRREDNRRT